MDKRLGNKVAVVTGGSAGIGLGAAKRLAAEGAQVFMHPLKERIVREVGYGLSLEGASAVELVNSTPAKIA